MTNDRGFIIIIIRGVGRGDQEEKKREVFSVGERGERVICHSFSSLTCKAMGKKANVEKKYVDFVNVKFGGNVASGASKKGGRSIADLGPLDAAGQGGGDGDVAKAFPTKAGDGILSFNLVGGKTTVGDIWSMSPLKFISPNSTPNSASNVQRTTDTVGAAWVYVIGFGGGLVSGDCIRVRASVGEGATAVVTTQASTKVYEQRHGKYCEQYLSSSVDSI